MSPASDRLIQLCSRREQAKHQYLHAQVTERRKELPVTLDWRYLSKEAVQNLPAVMIERGAVADQEVNALAVCNQQSCRCQPPNVFFTLENERRVAAVSFHLPGARSSKTRNLANTLDFRHEFRSEERRVGKECRWQCGA